MRERLRPDEKARLAKAELLQQIGQRFAYRFVVINHRYEQRRSIVPPQDGSRIHQRNSAPALWGRPLYFWYRFALAAVTRHVRKIRFQLS